MSNRRRGRPKGPARKFGPQTIYTAHKAIADYLPGARPTNVARLVGEALYVPQQLIRTPHCRRSRLLPTITASMAKPRQPFRLCMIGEKVSLGAVLRPVAKWARSELLLLTGEISETQAYGIIARAANDGSLVLRARRPSATDTISAMSAHNGAGNRPFDIGLSSGRHIIRAQQKSLGERGRTAPLLTSR